MNGAMSANPQAQVRPKPRGRHLFGLVHMELRKVRGTSFWWMTVGMMVLVSMWSAAAFSMRASSTSATLRTVELADGEVYQIVGLLAPILAALLTSRLAVLETGERMDLKWLSLGQSDAARFMGKLMVSGTLIAACFVVPLLWVPLVASNAGFTHATDLTALALAPAGVAFFASMAVAAVHLMLSMVLDKQAIGLGVGVVAGILGSGLGPMNQTALGWLFPAGISSAANPFIQSVGADGNARMLLTAHPIISVAASMIACLAWTLISTAIIKSKESRR